MARERRRPGWRGTYRGTAPGLFEVWLALVRADGALDRRSRPVSWGWWTPAQAQAVLNDPGKLARLALTADLLYDAVLEALRRLAKEEG